MENNERSVLLSLLTKAHNKTEDEIIPVLYDGEKLRENAADLILNMDAERVTKIRDSVTGKTQEFFNNGYKKAQAEVLGKFENEFKEKTGFASELTGHELFEAWGKTQAKTKIEDVKTTPEFLAKEKEIRTLAEQYEAKIQKMIADAEREKQVTGIKEKARAIAFNGEKKPVFPKSEAVRTNLEKLFLSTFDQFDYQSDGNGGILVIRDGKRVEDKHGNAVSFDAFVKEQASNYYEFEVQSPKGGSGGVMPPGGSGPEWIAGIKLATEQDYVDAMNKTTNPRDQVELTNKAKQLGLIPGY